MRQKIAHLYQNFGKVFKKYPVTIAFALLATIFAILSSEITDYQSSSLLLQKFPVLKEAPFIKLTIISLLGISLSFALSMLHEIKKWKWLAPISVLIVVGYYFLFPDDHRAYTSYHLTLMFVVGILHHLAVSFLPFLFHRNGEMGFWSYNKSLFTNLAQTVLFVGVLTAGLLLAIAAVENLFNLRFGNGKLYLYVTFISSIFGSCFVFLIFALDGFKGMVNDQLVPVAQKFFVQYIIIPLLLIYAAILYAYGAKILIGWSLPQGWVSYMVIAYSFLGFVSLLLIFPLSKQTAKAWVRWFDRIFYYSLLPFLILLFVAIFTRIFEYGVTPNRYFVLIIALWITVIALYFILFKKPSIKTIPISLFLFGLISISFPYLNAFSVSKRSQKNQFVELIEKFGIVENNKIDFEKEIESNKADQLSSIAFYLHKNGQAEFLDVYLEGTSSDSIFKYQYSNTYDFKKEFKNVILDDRYYEIFEITIQSKQYKKSRFLDVSEYDFVYSSIATFQEHSLEIGNEVLEISQNHWGGVEPKKLLFNLIDENGMSIGKYDMIDDLKQIYESKSNAEKTGISEFEEDIEYEFSLGAYEFTVLFYEIRFSANYSQEKNEDRWDFENVYFYPQYEILVKKKKH
ncbi:DUF4153 domain-containing protein [Belliella marina]|uniref:DUF4153 domain-containing protein n=1 Tax=Belliella marina TaxID=1644146 RepID=A0ABW4VVE3_9BACT